MRQGSSTSLSARGITKRRAHKARAEHKLELKRHYQKKGTQGKS